MTISQEGIDITNRFFKAIDILKTNKKIRGLQTFTRAHNFNRWNMVTVRNDPEHGYLKPEWIYHLCKDYGVSLKWIFYGTGTFYNHEAND